MTRFLRTALTAAVAVGGAAATGCSGGPGAQARYNDFVDPNYPQRYSYQARESVLHPHETQVRNALVADATVSNYLFEAGTDKLTDAGRQRLDYVARRGECADGHLYLQTARDLPFDPANPGKLVADRANLDAKRGQAVLAYMGAQPGGKPYDITPSDPKDTRMSAMGPASAVRGLTGQYSSGITGLAGLPLTGLGGGPAPGAPGVPNSGTPGAGSTTINTGPAGGGSSSSSGGGYSPQGGNAPPSGAPGSGM